jgi:hypothetical protein
MLKIPRWLILVTIATFLPSMACADEAPAKPSYPAPEQRHPLLSEALRQLQETYEAIHDPRLFLPMARLHFQLGDEHEALKHYRRFLAEVPDASPEDKQEAEAQVTHLNSILGSSAQPAPLQGAMQAAPAIIEERLLPFEELPSVRFVRRRNRGLIVAGSVMLSLAWTGALVAGVVSGLRAGDTPLGAPGFPDAAAKERQVDSLFLLGLPVAGPIVTATIANDHIVSPLVAIVAGLPQIAGLAMIIGGATSNSLLNDRKPIADLRLHPSVGLSSAGLALSGRF